MKWALAILCCFSVGLGSAGAAELTGGRTVYLLPMAHSLDQFLADRLTRDHVFQVVTDPAKADTVITDRVGAALQSRLKELYPPPESKEASKQTSKAATSDTPKSTTAETTKATTAETTKSAGDQPPATSGAIAAFGDAANKVDQAGSMASFGHGRGNVFLVDVKSSQVLWSIFEIPRDNSPRELDRTAARIVKHLMEDLAPK